MTDRNDSFFADGRNFLRGLCMGCADVVPGVSGGTVALILGIYERLVTAISHVDGISLGLLRRGEWRKLCEHLDMRFLLGLGAGIGTGIVSMTLVINRLLTNDTSRALTMAAFFGMILASAVLVAKLIKTSTPSQTMGCAALGLLAAAFAYWVSTLTGSGTLGEPSYAYVFLCGCVGICAMILPGISGAMILLVLGIYVHLTEIPHNLLAGEHVREGLLTIAVFASGCLISLILFSKLLRWLLWRHHAVTMSILCGFMFGALRKLWPFQVDRTPEIHKFKEKVFEVVWPPFDAQFLLVLFTAVLAAVFVLVVDRSIRQRQATAMPADTDTP